MRDLFYAYLRYWDVPTSEEEEETDTHEDDSADFAEMILVPVPLEWSSAVC